MGEQEDDKEGRYGHLPDLLRLRDVEDGEISSYLLEREGVSVAEVIQIILEHIGGRGGGRIEGCDKDIGHVPLIPEVI